jgi:hypothetical protein
MRSAERLACPDVAYRGFVGTYVLPAYRSATDPAASLMRRGVAEVRIAPRPGVGQASGLR